MLARGIGCLAKSGKRAVCLSRNIGCKKLEPLASSITKAIGMNDERIKNSYKGVSLGHSLALLTALLTTRDFRKYGFTKDLFQAVTTKIEDITKKKTKQGFPLELVIDLIECLNCLVNSKEVNPHELSSEEEKLVILSLDLITKNLVLLNQEEHRIVEDCARILDEIKEYLIDDLRILVDKLLSKIKKQRKFKNTQFTEEYFKAFGLKSFMETEKDFEFDFNREFHCLEMVKKSANTTFALFPISNNGVVDHVKMFKKYLEEKDQIDSFVIEMSPVLNPNYFKRDKIEDEKYMEYVQSMITEWPYLYKFHGQADLRKFYFSIVFDKQLYEEKDLLFYYKVDQHSRVFDPIHTLLAYFSGFGERTTAPSLYLSSLLTEEKTMEATYSMTTQRAKQLCDLHSLLHFFAGLSLIEESEKTGCQHCGGEYNNLKYYQTMDKINRGEFESKRAGHINSSVFMEAFQRLPEGTRGVYTSSVGGFDRTFPQILEKIRQSRLSDFNPLNFDRSDHIKKVYKESKTAVNDDLFVRLAYIENILGTLESTLTQFIDLSTTNETINHYQTAKEEIYGLNTLHNWDPSYQDDGSKQEFCLAENTVLPFEIDSKQYDRPVWSIGKKGEKPLLQLLDEKISNMEKISEEEKHGRGRKIKMKSKTPLLEKGRVPEGFYEGSRPLSKFSKKK